MSNTLNFVLASPNKAADKIDEMEKHLEILEAALRLTRPYIEMHTLSPNGTMATVLAKIDAALDQSSPPARQENDDVFKGFRGNNEA
jgi:hypothetical protein